MLIGVISLEKWVCFLGHLVFLSHNNRTRLHVVTCINDTPRHSDVLGREIRVKPISLTFLEEIVTNSVCHLLAFSPIVLVAFDLVVESWGVVSALGRHLLFLVS